MTATPPAPATRRRSSLGWAALTVSMTFLAVVIGVVALWTWPAPSPSPTPKPLPPAPKPASPSAGYLQATLFGVIATPDDTSIDPKLNKVNIAPHLRKLKPGHGFHLIGVSSDRLAAGESITLELNDQTHATARLINPNDANGKVRFQFVLAVAGQPEFVTIVRTPPNQLFFCEKTLPDNRQLLIGVGAR